MQRLNRLANAVNFTDIHMWWERGRSRVWHSTPLHSTRLSFCSFNVLLRAPHVAGTHNFDVVKCISMTSTTNCKQIFGCCGLVPTATAATSPPPSHTLAKRGAQKLLMQQHLNAKCWLCLWLCLTIKRLSGATHCYHLLIACITQILQPVNTLWIHGPQAAMSLGVGWVKISEWFTRKAAKVVGFKVFSDSRAVPDL